MNPILLGRQVAANIRGLVSDTLNTTSPAFEGIVERFVAEPNNLLKGPYIRVDLPFRSVMGDDGTWAEPFPEIPLGFAPYLHQAKTFERLRGETARSTLVATGTGSGKTESYLWPILDHCRQTKDQPGIKAILIYPMNALANDQAGRIAKAIARTPSLSGVRAGLYADAEPKDARDAMAPEGVITRRETMRRKPPDILLTNYKMLDYLLLRGGDAALWERNDPETLRFLVVDELHTFDGAQGADLALLLRRLKYRLGTPEGRLVCVGSSATLGSGDEAGAELRRYGARIFGEPFDEDAVIREARRPLADLLPPPDYVDVPDPADVQRALTEACKLGQSEAALRMARVLFPDTADREIADLHSGDPAAAEWRLGLGELLKQHFLVQRVLQEVAASAGAASLERIGEQLANIKTIAGWSQDDRAALAELVVSLLSWARSGDAARLSPLFGVRVEYWIREMARMVARLPRTVGDGQRSAITLHHAADLDPENLRKALPVVHCTRCGTAAHLGRLPPSGGSLGADLRTLYDEFFDGRSGRLRLIYHEPVSRKSGTTGRSEVRTGFLDADTLDFKDGDIEESLPAGPHAPVWLYTPSDGQGRIDRTCPACGHAHGLLLFGLRAARLTAALTNTLYSSEHNEERGEAKPRLLMFSDAIQDAAQRAAVAEIRNAGAVNRKALFSALARSEARALTLSGVIEQLPSRLRAQLGDAPFVATFIARDQTWRQPYKDLVDNGELPEDPRFLGHVELRLGWEFFSDLTYRAHTSQTLETTGHVVADVAPDRLRDLAKRLSERLSVEIGDGFDLDAEDSFRFLFGILQQMRRRGAVAHTYLVEALSAKPARGGGPNFFAASRALGLGNTRTLPIPDPRRASAPTAATPRGALEGYDSLTRDHRTNWYRDWADRFLIGRDVSILSKYKDLFAEIMKLLVAEGIVRRVERRDDPAEFGYVIEPDAIVVSRDVQRLRCDRCNRREIVDADNREAVGSLCTRIGCFGTLAHDAGDGAGHSDALLDSPRLHRVVGREHTGVLEAEARRGLERGFIDGEYPWSPNLVSATPTLEMGIDIGDLSTLLLCSVPPEEANYVQRVGRSGRRDGNALNMTIANARPHDLQFWEDPVNMINGAVRPPGVHIGALSVLERQIAAFTLDAFVASGTAPAEYGKLRDALKTRDDPAGGFPNGWIRFIRERGTRLADAFLDLLPEEISGRPEIATRVKEFLTTDGHGSLVMRIDDKFREAAGYRERLVQRRKDLDNAIRRARNASPPPKDLDQVINDLKTEKTEVNQTIRREIDDEKVLKYLTDQGLLPNYAFPEEGVKLKSVLTRNADPARQAGNAGDRLETREYVRPASAALSELAPDQIFYADGREVRINRLEIGKDDMVSWRFCQRCAHVAHTGEDTADASRDTCPNCADPMWSDEGSLHRVVELKTAVAFTSEEKAVIRDADDRQQEQYERSLVPRYRSDHILTSWASTGEETSTPFGYEFIAPCDFTDFNFGKRADAPTGPMVAGEQLKAVQFRLCRFCGHVQDRPRGDDDAGKHQPRCQTRQPGADVGRADWERRVFLLRRFTSEALRVVMPVVGEVEDDDIKSFVAGFELGLRRHFAGRVDHIRSTVVSAPIQDHVAVKSLYLYDMVPGGSGYLRQLAEHPSTMRNVIDEAVRTLGACPCAEEGRDGCFRCVKSYRSQFGPGEPTRERALRLMREVLSHWDHLREADSGVDDRIRDSMVESTLEARFLGALARRFGEDRLRSRVVEAGRRGFQLDLRPEGGGSWLIEPQVQIDRRYADLPRKRVDFLISPVSGQASLPIVVEMDGLAHHAGEVAEDLEARLLMIRSGRVRVWTLTWSDLDDEETGALRNPLAPVRLGEELAGILGRYLSQFGTRALGSDLELIQQGRAFDGLCRHLLVHGRSLAPAASVLSRALIGRGRALADLPRIATLRPEIHGYLEDAARHGHTEDGGLDLYLGAKDAPPPEWPDHPRGCRVVLSATLPQPGAAANPSPEFSAAWRGLWRLVNMLQDLAGFHVAFDGLDTVGPPDPDGPASQTSSAWVPLFDELDPGFHPLAQALQAAEIPPPDAIGLDLVAGDRIVGMAEMAWTGAAVAVSADVRDAPGWTVIFADPETEPDLVQVVQEILDALKEAVA